MSEGGSSVAVVVPCHDYGSYLREAVQSVCAQTRPPDELVVVDDGSRDTTPGVLADLQREIPGLVTLRHEVALGPAAACNAGIAATTASLVMVLDADDRLSPTYLADTERTIIDGDVDFAYTGERRFGAEESWRPAPPFDRRALLRHNYINKSALCRRWIFERTGGFRPDFDRLGMEDWELWVHALRLGGEGRAVGSCWLDYRRHVNGSRSSLSRRRDALVHLRMWQLHRPTVRLSDLAWWAAGAAARKVRCSSPPGGDPGRSPA